ncbi:MAG TPA: radical SAM protein, partial [Candidatus Acidoferrales bacterium]|nr:radical SAM protein [Candidatus Acidoferrales bacterium]
MPETNKFARSEDARARLAKSSLNDSLSECSAHVRGALECALEGGKLASEEGILLARAGDSDLGAVLKTADELRRRVNGSAITYVVNRNLNFTNICYVGCSFCGFGVGAHSPEAYLHSFEKLIEKSREAAAAGATEVCIQGGLPRDLDGFYYRNLLRAIKTVLPQIHCHAFSPMEIANGMEKTGMPVRDYL